MGVVDLLSEATAAVGGVGSSLVCLTDEVTANQVRDLVVKFLQEHPAELNYSAASLASRAVAAAWPCPPSFHEGRPVSNLTTFLPGVEAWCRRADIAYVPMNRVRGADHLHPPKGTTARRV